MLTFVAFVKKGQCGALVLPLSQMNLIIFFLSFCCSSVNHPGNICIEGWDINVYRNSNNKKLLTQNLYFFLTLTIETYTKWYEH